MEKSQNESGKGSKNLMDNRKCFNMLYITGEQGGWDIGTFRPELPTFS